MSFRDTANVALFSVTVSGRTITPSGVVFIGDIRMRRPIATGAAVTLTGSTDGDTQYIFALAVSGDTYQLVASTDPGYATGRSDLQLVGTALDLPSRGGCIWLPAKGGSLDPFLFTDKTGMHVQGVNPSAGYTVWFWDDPLGVQNRFAGHGQEIRYDQYGHLILYQDQGPSLTFGPGAGSGGVSGQVYGTDQVGLLGVSTGPTAPTGNNSIIVEVVFRYPWSSWALVNPHTVLITPANNVTAALSGTIIPYVVPYDATKWRLMSGQTGLAASTTYQWNYLCF